MLNITFKERIIIIVIAVCAIPIHELGHWLGYRLSSVPATFHYSYTEPLTNIQSIWGLAGGPIISLVLALFGVMMIHINKNNQDIWAYFSVVMCLTRLLPYLLLLLTPSNFTENDEGLIAKVLNLQASLVYIIFITLFIGIISIIVYKLEGDFYKHMKKYKYGYLLYLILLIFTGIEII